MMVIELCSKQNLLLMLVTKVGFESPTYTISEGSSTSVCLTFDRKLEKSISLNYTLEALAIGMNMSRIQDMKWWGSCEISTK